MTRPTIGNGATLGINADTDSRMVQLQTTLQRHRSYHALLNDQGLLHGDGTIRRIDANGKATLGAFVDGEFVQR